MAAQPLFWAFRLLVVSVPQSHLAALRFLDDLGFERFGIRATLAHGNPSDKGDRVRLKYAETIIFNAGVWQVSSPDAYRA